MELYLNLAGIILRTARSFQILRSESKLSPLDEEMEGVEHLQAVLVAENLLEISVIFAFQLALGATLFHDPHYSVLHHIGEGDQGVARVHFCIDGISQNHLFSKQHLFNHDGEGFRGLDDSLVECIFFHPKNQLVVLEVESEGLFVDQILALQFVD